ncbi:hypothetical protein HCB69_09090, partial [Listeria booriae]
LKSEITNLLQTAYGNDWFINEAVPKKVYDMAIKNASDKNYLEKRTDITGVDCLTLSNYRDIMLNKSNWRDIFEKKYTRPEDSRISGGKKAKTEWLQKVYELQKKNFDEYSVTKDEFNLLNSLQQWLSPIHSSIK